MPPISFKNLFKKWATKSILSILDQGLLSLINFLINIHLSRVLPAKEYGIFAIVFSVYLLILTFNQALILEPLNIIGMTRYRDRLISYFKKITIIQFIASIALSGLIILAAMYFLYLNNPIYYPLISLGIVGPFICTFFLIRRFCYLLYAPAIALVGTFFYSVSLLVAYYFLVTKTTVNVFNVFLLLGGASVVSSLVIIAILYTRHKSFLKTFIHTKIVLYKHWSLGKWVLAATTIGWLSTSVYFPLVGGFIGLEASASLKAIDNLLLPMQQVITALSLLIIPKIAGSMNRDRNYLRETSKKLILFFTSVVIVYLCLLIIFGKNLVFLLYGNDTMYVNYLWLLPLIAIPLIARAIADIGIGIPLRIVERFDVLFKSSAINSLFSLSIGIFLVWKYGVLGAALAIAIGSVIQLTLSLFYFNKVFGIKRN